jgi:hypothetical protein
MRAAGERAGRLGKPSKHTGFQNLDYREGVNADGSLA